MSDQPIPNIPPAPEHNKLETNLLLVSYVNHRLKAQMQFYTDRIDEYANNADWAFSMATFIMVVTAFLSATNVLFNSSIVIVVSALLPSVAGMLAAFRQLYSWDRQVTVYQDAIRGLRNTRLLIPDDEELPLKEAELPLIYRNLVNSGEEVFKGEMSQWGQFILDKDKATAQEEAQNDPFDRLITSLNLSEEQVGQIRNIINAGKTPT